MINEGLSAVKDAGIVTPRTCPEEHIHFDADENSSAVPVPAGTGDFCSNPAGYLCRINDTQAKLEAVRSYRAQLGSSSRAGLDMFQTQLSGAGNGRNNIQATFDQLKIQYGQKIDSCTKCSPETKNEMKNKINSAILSIASTNNPAGSEESEACGVDGFANNAGYINGKVILCLGRIVHAAPAVGTPQGINMGQNVYGTLAHELGHALDTVKIEIPQKNSIPLTQPVPWTNEVEACLDKTSTKMGNRLEARADFWANAMIGQLSGENFDRAIQGRGSLCSSQGGNGHPLTVNRLLFLRASPGVAEKRCVGQPVPSPGQCFNEAWIR